MVLQIIVDTKWFYVVLAILIMATTSSFYVLLHRLQAGTDLPFRPPAAALFSLHATLLYGEFDAGELFVGEYSVLLYLIFALAMALVLLCALNLLISIMSDSYERIQERATDEFRLLRGRLLVDLAAQLSPEERHQHQPPWLHVVVPCDVFDGSVHEDADDSWNGMLGSLRNEIRAAANASRDAHANLAARLDAIERQLAEKQH